MGMLFKKIVMVESLPVVFMGAGAGVGAGKKIPGAGQRRTGSATLYIISDKHHNS